MTDIEKKHLEAIEEVYGNTSKVRSNRLSQSCARITQRHGEIQRLEGMIEGFRLSFRSDKYDDIIAIEKQLKALKNE